MTQKIYWIEEKDRSPRRYYVYYTQDARNKVLFDVCETNEKAEQAIKDHKNGKHGTQWKPE